MKTSTRETGTSLTSVSTRNHLQANKRNHTLKMSIQLLRPMRTTTMKLKTSWHPVKGSSTWASNSLTSVSMAVTRVLSISSRLLFIPLLTSISIMMRKSKLLKRNQSSSTDSWMIKSTTPSKRTSLSSMTSQLTTSPSWSNLSVNTGVNTRPR